MSGLQPISTDIFYISLWLVVIFRESIREWDEGTTVLLDGSRFLWIPPTVPCA